MTDESEAEEETEETDGPPLTVRLYDGANSIQTTVRTRTAPLIAGAEDYLKPLLTARPLGLLIALVVLLTAGGGAFIFASQTLGQYTTAVLLTIALVAGSLGLLAAGAVAWGGSRHTSYW
jgi:hypothetical protein